MSRTKTVFPADMVCHVWANGTTSEARTASGNLKSENGILLSYGHHFAIGAFVTIAGTRYLFWNDATYSNTTSKHQSKAWQALTQTQRMNAVHVPGMNSDINRPSHMAGIAEDVINFACEFLEKSDKARQNRHGYITKARGYFEAARLLFTGAGKHKRAASVPHVHADLGRAEIDAVLHGLRGAQYLEKARTALARAVPFMASLQGEFSAYQTRRNECNAAQWVEYLKARIDRNGAHNLPANNVGRRGVDLVRLCESTIAFYKKAGTKPAPAIVRINKAARDIVSALQADAKIENDLAYKIDVETGYKTAFKAYREYLASPRTRADSEAIEWQARRFTGRIEKPAIIAALPDCERFSNRLARVVVANRVRYACDTAEKAIEQFKLHPASSANNPPAFSPIVSQMSILRGIAGADSAVAHLAPRADALILQLQTMHAENEARILQLNAARVDAWRNGENVTLPHNIPTMARIKADSVETSRGASVPLAHAVRLVKIAQRVAQRGGQAWAQGTGPAVGHFRVNRIGADLSAVIGCHEFSAAESARIIAQIEQCAEFASVADTLAD